MPDPPLPPPGRCPPTPPGDDTMALAQPDDLTLAGSPGGDVRLDDVPLSSAGAFLVCCQGLVNLPAEVADAIGRQMTKVSFEAGQPLLRQGQPGPGLLALLAGEVEVRTEDGDGSRVIDRVASCNVFGEMSLLTGEPCTATVVATRPSTAWLLPAAEFHALASQHPRLAVLLTHLVASRLGYQGRDILGGKTFSGYRIDRRLGRGGMAVVYAGQEVASGRPVALKMMSHRLVYDPQAFDRFQREADVVASLQHPNIARLLGRFAAFRTWFLVMELCDGPTLADVIRQGPPLPEPVIRGILGQLALALEHAHAAGVIHRDLKPANILLTRDGVLKLTDFGLARTAGQESLTERGNLVGTPRYMAPEQLAGKSSDARGDLYAFGLVAWEMLTGRPRFEQTDLLALVYQQMTAELPPAEAIRPGLCGELYQLLGRCLATDPAARPASAAAFAPWAAAVPREFLLAPAPSA